jgi:hypothetical protein
MLLQDLATLAQEAQMNLPLKGPAVPTSWRFWPDSEALDSWHLLPDNPLWGNNAEASSSSGPRKPRLQLIQAVPPQDDPPLLLQAAVDNPPLPLQAAVDMTQMEESGKEIVIYNQEFALKQIIENLHPEALEFTSMGFSQGINDAIYEMEIDDDGNQVSDGLMVVDTPSPGQKKRKARAKTPIVDDEVRRILRFKKNFGAKHIQLDKEPRRKKGEAKKTVYFSTVEDLKTAIISRRLDEEMAAEDIEPIQTVTLADLGISFCGVPPEEITEAALTPSNQE